MPGMLTPRRLRAAAVVTTALVPASLIYAVATADTGGRARTAVTVTAVGDGVSGTVRSSRHACTVDRTVRLMRQTGPRGRGHDRVVADGTTDSRGRIRIAAAGLDGRYYAEVVRTGHCRAAVSDLLVAGR